MKHIAAIDFLKGLAIVAVTILHSLQGDSLLFQVCSFFGIATLVILIGVNASLKGQIEITSKYLWNKAKRLLPPLVPVLAILYFTVGIQNGMGMYFVVLVLEAVLVVPMMQRVAAYSKPLLLIPTFLASLYFEYSSYPFGLTYNQVPILRWLFALAIGVVLVDIIRSKDSAWLLMLVPLYLIPINAGVQYELSMLFLAGIIFAAVYLNISNRVVDLLGKASYHIFMANMVWFIFLDYGLVINTTGILLAGVIFYTFFYILSILTTKYEMPILRSRLEL